MTIAVALIVAPMVAQQPPLVVVWNASQSVPVGLYLVTKASPRVGDLVALRLPPVIAAFAARRGYLPTSAYLVKPIAAVAGDLVCRFGEQVFVRGGLAAPAKAADDDGNAMPAWEGCRVLRTGEVIVLADHPASFDSRYFGPLDTTSIVGRVAFLWPHRPAHSRLPGWSPFPGARHTCL
jgi:conjugative transfer signal peptidase TraF